MRLPDALHSAGAKTRSVSRSHHLCGLHLGARGKHEPCTDERCAFWEPGGAVAPGDCLIERLGIDARRGDLASYLLETRERLEQTKSLVEAEATHRELARRIGREF